MILPLAPLTALVVFIIFMATMGVFFLFDILSLFLNGIVILAIALRSFAEIEKEKKCKAYGIGVILSIILTVLFGNLLALWWITTLIVLAFLIAQIVLLLSVAKIIEMK